MRRNIARLLKPSTIKFKRKLKNMIPKSHFLLTSIPKHCQQLNKADSTGNKIGK